MSPSQRIELIIEQAKAHVIQITGGEIRIREMEERSVFPLYSERGGLATSLCCALENTEVGLVLKEIVFNLSDDERTVRTKISEGIIDAQDNLLRMRGPAVPDTPQTDSIRPIQMGVDGRYFIQSTRMPIRINYPGVFQVEEIERAVQFLRENPDFFSSQNQNKVKGRRIKLERSD